MTPFYMRNRTGEFTRGMLVVDRRDDVGAYAPGDNRSHAQQELDRHRALYGPPEPAVIPAPVLEEAVDKKKPGVGVFTVVETPGQSACLELLFQRIWGISRQP